MHNFYKWKILFFQVYVLKAYSWRKSVCVRGCKSGSPRPLSLLQTMLLLVWKEEDAQWLILALGFFLFFFHVFVNLKVLIQSYTSSRRGKNDSQDDDEDSRTISQSSMAAVLLLFVASSSSYDYYSLEWKRTAFRFVCRGKDQFWSCFSRYVCLILRIRNNIRITNAILNNQLLLLYYHKQFSNNISFS